MTGTPRGRWSAARQRLDAVEPAAYARTRNALDGAVTGLSPYLTHGFLTLEGVLAHLRERHPQLSMQHKLVFELGWRAYFRHVWAARGDGIFSSLHEGPLPDAAYATELPADIRQARTGVPVVDQAVRTLYATGTLHNHARLWLASYVVHLRKLHWRAGADWLYAHLLDGDLASNHLSWQWVAGTASAKPYLFNADNVARHAPPAWHSGGSVIDRPYDALDAWARAAASVAPAGTRGHGVDEPAWVDGPPASMGLLLPQAADADAIAGREVWLIHPWSLGAPPPGLPADVVTAAVAVDEFHAAWPWAEGRWRFVAERLDEMRPQRRWRGSRAALAALMRHARRVHLWDDPHVRDLQIPSAVRHLPPSPFPEIATRCDSFSRWWTQVQKRMPSPDPATDPAHA